MHLLPVSRSPNVGGFSLGTSARVLQTFSMAIGGGSWALTTVISLSLPCALLLLARGSKRSENFCSSTACQHNNFDACLQTEARLFPSSRDPRLHPTRSKMSVHCARFAGAVYLLVLAVTCPVRVGAFGEAGYAVTVRQIVAAALLTRRGVDSSRARRR